MQSLETMRAFYADLVTTRAGVTDPRIRSAFRTVDRARYLGPGPWKVKVADGYIETPSDDPVLVFQDIVIALAADQRINNGEPSLHARPMGAVAPRAGERVLHIGCGSGYYTALLAQLVGSDGYVVALEIEPTLARAARENLRDCRTVAVEQRSGTTPPLPESDIIYVSAGATEPVRAWVDALRPGGRLIFPLTPGWEWGAMLMVTRQPNGFAAKFVSDAMFIPCVGAQDDATRDRLRAAFERGHSDGVQSLIVGAGPPDETCWLDGRGWWLSTRPT